MGNLLLT